MRPCLDHGIVKEIPIAFAYIFIPFIVLVASFMFHSLEPLDKYSQYYHSIIRLDLCTSVLDKIIAIMLIVD